MTRSALPPVDGDGTPRTSLVRIFISSPGDVAEERDHARRVIESLQRRYPGVRLEPVLWEELALPATASFQESIDFVLHRQPVDVAVFILWSRLGSPIGAAAIRPDGTPYRSGTEREFDLMLAAYQQSGRQRPVILAYARDDDAGFRAILSQRPGDELEELIRQRGLAETFIREQFHDSDGHNLRAYHSYSEPVGFAQRLNAHLRQVLDDLVGNRDAEPQWLDAPYRGLEHFDIEHAAIFHGRDAETCEILQRLRDRERGGCASVVIVGASGSGKSSLARAGVAATLAQNAFDSGVREWRVVPFLPGLGDGPLLPRLVAALADKLPALTDAGTRLDDVAAGLTESPTLTTRLSIVPAFQKASADAGGPVRVLLLLDQMEELWTGQQITEAERAQFLAAVEALARCGHVAVLATLRSDFYPHAQQSEAFLRLKEDRGHFDLLPPGPAALQRLITEPARLAGVSFERNDATGQTLDQLILQDAARDPSALPLLEYALDELYQRRTGAQGTSPTASAAASGTATASGAPSTTTSPAHTPAGTSAAARPLLTFDAYEQLGGVEGALGRRAAETFSRLPADAQAALPEILPLLVTVDVAGEQSAVRRRAPLSDLTSTPQRRALTEALIAARFLTTDRHGEAATASLSHEALLRRWESLAAWVRQNRDHLRLRARVEQSEQRWHDAARHATLLLPAGLPLEEGRQLLYEARPLLRADTAHYVELSLAHHETQSRRARRLRNAVVTALSLLALLATTGGIVAWNQQQDATTQRNVAINNAAEVTRKNAELNLKNDEITRSNERNLELIRTASMAAHAAARKAWHEHDDAQRNGKWARSVGPASKWHEAVAHWARALELDPDNELASGWLYDTIRRRGRSLGIAPPKVLWNEAKVRQSMFTPDGRRVVTAAKIAADDLFEFQTQSNNPDVVKPESAWIVQVWDVNSGLPIGDPLRHGSPITLVSISPDGRKVATAGGDRTVRIWDAATAEPVGKTLPHESAVMAAEFSPDGARLVTWSRELKGACRLWNTSTGDPVGSPLGNHGIMRAMAFSPDGSLIATTGDDSTIRFWDSATGTAAGRETRFDGVVTNLEFSREGTRILAAGATIAQKSGWDGTPIYGRFVFSGQIWDVASRNPLGGQFTSDVRPRLGPDGTRVVTTDENIVQIRDVTTGSPIGQTMPFGWTVGTVDFSPDGTRLVTTGGENAARIWDASNGRPVGLTLEHDHGHVASATFSPDGNFVVTAGSDDSARVWDAETGAPLGGALLHSSGVSCSMFSPDGSRVLTVCDDQIVRIFHLLTDVGSVSPLATGGDIGTTRVSPDRRGLAVFSTGNTAQVWNIAKGVAVGDPVEHEQQINDIDFSPDGRRIATASSDQTVRLWDASHGTPIGEPLLHEGVVASVRFNRDGTRLVTASNDGTARVWDLSAGKPIGPALRHRDSVSLAEFSPDGKRIVTASKDKTARIWDASTALPIGAAMSHGDEVWFARFNAGSDRVVTVCNDRTVRIWDAASGIPVCEPLRNDVVSVRFSPDGSRLVTVSVDGTVRIWAADRGLPLGDPLSADARNAEFSPDGAMLATGGRDGDVRIWNLAAGATVGEVFPHEVHAVVPHFSPGGSVLVTTTRDDPFASIRSSPYQSVRVWEFAAPDDRKQISRVGPEVTQWVRGVAGLRFRQNGELEVIAERERENLRNAPLPDGAWAELDGWMRSTGPDRPVGLRTAQTARELAARERDLGGPRNIKSAIHRDPTVPLARMMLANLREKVERERVRRKAMQPSATADASIPAIAEIPGKSLLEDVPPGGGGLAADPTQLDAGVLARAAHWRRYDLDRLPEDAALWERAATILREMPDAQVGVGPKPIRASEVADQAERRAAGIRARAAAKKN